MRALGRLARLGREPDRPDVEVAPGERVLAWCVADDGAVLAGTSAALYLPGRRVPWEQIEAADWDNDTARLRVSEVGSWGEQRPEHDFVVEDPRRLAELVRERVTASVVVQRHVPVPGAGERRASGVRVIARRAPAGSGGAAGLSWFYEYDEDVDPDDPAVRAAAAEALAAARADVGD